MEEYIKYGWYIPESKKQYIYRHVNGNEVHVSCVTSEMINPYENSYYKGTEIYVGEVTKFIKSFENKNKKFDFNIIKTIQNKINKNNG